MYNSRRKLVVWGAGGHALVVSDIIRTGEDFELVGHLIDSDHRHAIRKELQATNLGGRERLDELWNAGVRHVVVAVGDCHARLEIADMLRCRGFLLATVIHSRSIIARNVPIGAGTVVAAGAVINPGAVVGQSVIVNTSAVLDHECVINDGAHISPGALLAGGVEVGRATWLGIGAVVIQKVRIGANCLIGAGAVVCRDIPDGVMAYGVPARVTRTIETPH